MESKQLKEMILGVLADAWDELGAHQGLSTDVLAKRIGEPVASVKSAMRTLAALNLINTAIGGGLAVLTPQGYAGVRQDHPGGRGQGGGTNIVFHGPVSNSAIAAGGSQATVTNISHTVLQELAREIESRPDIPAEEKQGLVEAAKKLAAHPIVAAALGAVLGRILGP